MGLLRALWEWLTCDVEDWFEIDFEEDDTQYTPQEDL